MNQTQKSSAVSASLNKPTVLVTGGAGYIGSHAARALRVAGYTPVVFDNLSAGRRERVMFGPLVVGDIRNRTAVEGVIDTYKPQAVLHFAGLIAVGQSVIDPGPTYDVNVGGSLVLLAAVRAAGIRHVVFSSTAAVYGQGADVLLKESAPKVPINPYGRSKLVVEQLLADYHAANGLSYAALRYFNAAGATPEAGLGYLRSDPTHLIPIALQAMLGQRAPLKVFGTDYPTPDGTAVRDYLHVQDLADAHVLALDRLMSEPTPTTMTLNLGTSRGHSVRDVIDEIAKFGMPVPHTLGPRRAGDPAVLVADADAARRVLNWNPSRSSLTQIIQDDLAWHQSLCNASAVA